MPYSPAQKSCVQLKDHKGKTTGLMMEGSLAHMEANELKRKNLMTDMPIDNRGVGEMSPYKLTEKEKPTEESEGVVVTGDASKVGAYGKELDTIFSSIQDTLDKGGYSSSRAQKEAGLGYGTSASKEFGRLQKMRQEEGVIPTLRYIKRRSRN